MCIIAVKPQNVAIPSQEILERIFDKNPDGAGIAYTTNGGIKIIKGIMSKGEFLKVCQKIPTKASAIIHTRISTSGGICKELTHPYKLTNDFKELRKTNIEIKKNDFAVAHNGIFSEFGTMQNANDTMQFIATYLTPLKELKEKNGGKITDNDITPIINRLVNGSRLVIMATDGEFKTYGNGWSEQNGIYYSNEGYKKPTYTYYDYWNDLEDYGGNNYNYYNEYYGTKYQPTSKGDYILTAKSLKEYENNAEVKKEKSKIQELFSKYSKK